MKTKGLFFFRGESFRPYGDDSTRSFQLQQECTSSHLKLIDKLRNHGHTVDVYLDTVYTHHFPKLLENYSYEYNHNVEWSIRSQKDISQYAALMRSMCSCDGEISRAIHFECPYDYLFISRFDLIFKDYFIDLFDPYDQVVKFPSPCYPDALTELGKPYVLDHFFFIPQKYLSVRHYWDFEIQCNFHKILDIWYSQVPDLKFDFYTKTFHSGRTDEDYNPLFIMNNRPYTEQRIYSDDIQYPEYPKKG